MALDTDEPPVDKKGEALVKYWLGEVSDAMKREKTYRKLGREVVDLYEAKVPDQTPFAILYSNTETLAPAVYNAVPIPIVTRRYKDADPIGKAVAEVSTRLLKFLISNETKDYDTYDELMQPAVLDGILTNRGVTRFRYMSAEGARVPECCYGDAVPWDKFFHGYAKTWKKVPWIGFEHDFSRSELKKNFPDAPLEDLRTMSSSDDGDDYQKSGETREELTGVRTYKAYEIWDKRTNKLYFISPVSKLPLRVVDNPLDLSTFFPVPKPLNFMKKSTTLVPTPLYQQYRQQAAELNDLTRRLKALIRACKYRGAYNSTVEGIDKMLEADDNQLVPVENIASMPDNVTMDKLLYIVPINELVQSVQTLYAQREQCKQVIYEITGISDILRGASVASETATAQNIKNQWGTLRLKKMQKEVQRYCRDSLAIMLEVAAGKFELDTIRQMTGLPYMTEAEKAQMKQQITEMQAAAQQAGVAAQAAGQQPPPPPPPVPPEVQLMLDAPSWDQIMQVLRNDVTLHYKVDIETNSTIDAEAAQDKQDISDILNAMAQFMGMVAPLIETGVMPMEIAKSMLLMITRRFNFGSQLEDAINAMAQPKPQTDPNQDAKNQAAAAQAQADQQAAALKSQETQQQMALNEQEFEQKKNLMLLQAEIDQSQLELKREEIALQRESLSMKADFNRQQHQMKLSSMKAKANGGQNASV